MPLYCSNTGSTALREAEVQQPNTAAHLSSTRSFFAFSAKVGQSLAPSSWMNLILRPSTPPAALICEIASFSASTEPVSLIAMVPVMECRMPTVTSVSVTARPGGIDRRGRRRREGVGREQRPPKPRRCRAAPFAVRGNTGRSPVFRLKTSQRPCPELPDVRGTRSFALRGTSLAGIVALQHTSNDVFAYALPRSKLLQQTGIKSVEQTDSVATPFALFCGAQCP